MDLGYLESMKIFKEEDPEGFEKYFENRFAKFYSLINNSFTFEKDSLSEVGFEKHPIDRIGFVKSVIETFDFKKLSYDPQGIVKYR